MWPDYPVLTVADMAAGLNYCSKTGANSGRDPYYNLSPATGTRTKIYLGKYLKTGQRKTETGQKPPQIPNPDLKPILVYSQQTPRPQGGSKGRSTFEFYNLHHRSIGIQGWVSCDISYDVIPYYTIPYWTIEHIFWGSIFLLLLRELGSK